MYERKILMSSEPDEDDIHNQILMRCAIIYHNLMETLNFSSVLQTSDSTNCKRID